MLVIAHRGANQEAIENSMPAMEKALAGGAQRIELDVQLSREGEPYIFHDDSLMRLCGQPHPFNQLSAAEISRMRLADGSPIPHAKEVLATMLPRVELNLEIKGGDPKTAEAIACLVARSALASRVVFSCFYPEPLRYLHLHYPKLTCAALWGYDTISINPCYFSAPQLFMDHSHCAIIHPEVALVTAAFMDQAKHRRWLVYPWISLTDEPLGQAPHLWQQLKNLGVNGLCTNWPRQFARWLKEQP